MAQYGGQPVMYVPSTGQQEVPVNGGQVVAQGNSGQVFVPNHGNNVYPVNEGQGLPVVGGNITPTHQSSRVAHVQGFDASTVQGVSMQMQNGAQVQYYNLPQVMQIPQQQQHPTRPHVVQQQYLPQSHYGQHQVSAQLPVQVAQPQTLIQPPGQPQPVSYVGQPQKYIGPSQVVLPVQIMRPVTVVMPPVPKTHTPPGVQSPVRHPSPTIQSPGPDASPKPWAPPKAVVHPLKPQGRYTPYLPLTPSEDTSLIGASFPELRATPPIFTGATTTERPGTPARRSASPPMVLSPNQHVPVGSLSKPARNFSTAVIPAESGEDTVKENLFRQYAEILREHKQGLTLDAQEFKDLEDTMSLEERDILDTEAHGSLKTFLEQSPQFIMAAESKVLLSVKEYLIQKFIRLVESCGKVDATGDNMIDIFISLKPEERKLIMATGSLKNFLVQSERVSVDGNVLYPKRDEWDDWEDEAPTVHTGNHTHNGGDTWKEEPEAKITYKSQAQNEVYSPPVSEGSSAYSRETSVDRVQSYSKPDWVSEEEQQRSLQEREEKSAKFEEIARKIGIQIVDPKTLEGGDGEFNEGISEEAILNELGGGDSAKTYKNNETKGDQEDITTDYGSERKSEERKDLAQPPDDVSEPKRNASSAHGVLEDTQSKLEKVKETKKESTLPEQIESNKKDGNKPKDEIKTAPDSDKTQAKDNVKEHVALESKLNPSVPEFKLSAAAPVFKPFQPSVNAPVFEPSVNAPVFEPTPRLTESPLSQGSASGRSGTPESRLSGSVDESSSDAAEGPKPFFFNRNPEREDNFKFTPPTPSSYKFKSLIDKSNEEYEDSDETESGDDCDDSDGSDIGVPEFVPRGYQRPSPVPPKNPPYQQPQYPLHPRERTPPVRTHHRSVQTAKRQMIETAVNTKKVRTREGVVQTEHKVAQTREVYINTEETIASECSDYFVMPTTRETRSAGTNTTKTPTVPKKTQVGTSINSTMKHAKTMTEKSDFVGMVDRIEFDEMEYRAVQAEEQILWLQLQMCLSELLRHSAEVELRQQQQLRLFAHSNEELRKMVDVDYRMNMDAIKEEMDRLEALYDSNLSSLRDGKRLSELRGISFTYPAMTPTRFNLGSAVEFRIRTLAYGAFPDSMASDSFNPSNRAAFQVTDIQQSSTSGSSLYNKPAPVNNPPPPQIRRDKPMAPPMVLGDRTRNVSAQQPPRKTVPRVKIIKKKKTTVQNDASSDTSSQTSRDKTNTPQEEKVQPSQPEPAGPPGLSANTTLTPAPATVEAPTTIQAPAQAVPVLPALEVLDPTPLLKEIILKMLQMNPELKNTPQILQMMSVDHLSQMQDKGLVRLSAQAQSVLSDLKEQTLRQMTMMQSDVQAVAPSSAAQLPSNETDDSSASAKDSENDQQEQHSVWKNSRLKKSSSDHVDSDTGSGISEIGVGAKPKTVSSSAPPGISGSSDEQIKTGATLEKHRFSGSEPSKSLSRENSVVSSSSVPDNWDDDLDDVGDILTVNHSGKSSPLGQEGFRVTPPVQDGSRATPPELDESRATPEPVERKSSWSSGVPASVKDKPLPNLPPRLQKKAQQTTKTPEAEKDTGFKWGKPLPVVASSISAVEVSKSALSAKNDTYKPQMGTVLGKLGKMKKVGGSTTRQSPEPFDVTEYQHPEVDVNDLPKPSTSRVHATILKDTRRMSEISDINFMDEILGAEGPEDEPPAAEDGEEDGEEWQAVAKKKRPPAVLGANFTFDKMINKIVERFPELTRDHAIAALNVVRTRRGTLRDATYTELLLEVDDVLNQGLVGTKSEDNTIVCKPTNLLWKTSICQYWKAGKCFQGSDCDYAHGTSELRQLPKFVLCSRYVRGECMHPSNKCIYAHGKEELRPMPAWMQQSLHTRGADAPQERPVPPRPSAENFISSVSMDAITPLYIQQTEYAGGAVSADGTWDDDGDACPVCFEGMTENNKISLDCGHEFHGACIKRWVMGEERTCPMCRQYALLPDEFPKLGM